MNNTIISICVPTYNRGYVVGSTLEMLLHESAEYRQTGDIEIIISDNCSTDNTWDQLKKYSAERNVTIVRNNENIGITRNLINCLSHSAGRFVWFFGDDDIIQPHLLRALVDLLSLGEYSFFVIPYRDFIEKNKIVFSDITNEVLQIQIESVALDFFCKNDRFLGFVTSCIYDASLLRAKLIRCDNAILNNDYLIKYLSYLFILEESAAIASGLCVYKRCAEGSHFVSSPAVMLKVFVYDVAEVGEKLRAQYFEFGNAFIDYQLSNWRLFFLLRQGGVNLRPVCNDLSLRSVAYRSLFYLRVFSLTPDWAIGILTWVQGAYRRFMRVRVSLNVGE